MAPTLAPLQMHSHSRKTLWVPVPSVNRPYFLSCLQLPSTMSSDALGPDAHAPGLEQLGRYLPGAHGFRPTQPSTESHVAGTAPVLGVASSTLWYFLAHVVGLAPSLCPRWSSATLFLRIQPT